MESENPEPFPEFSKAPPFATRGRRVLFFLPFKYTLNRRVDR